MNRSTFILFALQSYENRSYLKMIDEEYNIDVVYDLEELEKFIYNHKIDLIIVDISLVKTPENEHLIRWIIGRKMIPLITLVNNSEDILKSIGLKTIDFIYKPVEPKILKFQIHRILYYIKEMDIYSKMNILINDKYISASKELSELHANIISVLAEIIEFRDFYTSSYDMRSRAYIKLLIRKMIEIPNPYQREICLWDIEKHILASRLHDIGKIVIPDNILTKPGPLNETETRKMQEHVIAGVRIIDRIFERIGTNSYLQIAKKYIESHHEQWDGKGYPYKLSGKNIPLEGRIMAIVDTYDALTSERSYKKASSHETAVELINKNSGIMYDPNLVKIFNIALSEFKALNDTYV